MKQKRRKKYTKRRGGRVCDDAMTTTRDDRTRALVLVHTYIYITREVCVIAFCVLLCAPMMMNVHKKRICI